MHIAERETPSHGSGRDGIDERPVAKDPTDPTDPTDPMDEIISDLREAFHRGMILMAGQENAARRRRIAIWVAVSITLAGVILIAGTIVFVYHRRLF